MSFLQEYFKKYFSKLKCFVFKGLNIAKINITLKYRHFSIFLLKFDALKSILKAF